LHQWECRKLSRGNLQKIKCETFRKLPLIAFLHSAAEKWLPLLDNSQMRQLSYCQLTDWTTCRLDKSRTGQVVKWTTRGFHWRLCVFLFFGHSRDGELSSLRVDLSARCPVRELAIRELAIRELVYPRVVQYPKNSAFPQIAKLLFARIARQICNRCIAASSVWRPVVPSFLILCGPFSKEKGSSLQFRLTSKSLQHSKCHIILLVDVIGLNLNNPCDSCMDNRTN